MAEIKIELFRKKFATSPSRISPAILSLCQEINPDAKPIEVSVKPDIGAEPSECFYNVTARIKRDGGTMVYGWMIREWSRVFIEAEHHALWEKDGELRDITPKEPSERKIVFLPDPSADYDFEGNRRRINIKRSLGRFPSVDRWIAAADAYQQAFEDNSVKMSTRFDRVVFLAHQRAKMNAIADVVLDLAYETKPRDRCICASGKEFRKCCSKHIRF